MKMIKSYNFAENEKKWQEIWGKENCFEAKDFDKKKKFYALVEFPYPSGAGLHVGHIRAFTSMEIVSRKKRMEGYNVLFPIGWDAFGLPTENFAMQTGRNPHEVTQENIKTFTEQLKAVGYSFDWKRVIDTTDPKYYKWTQWIFVKLFNAGLAYKNKTYVNFCNKCKVVLANEEAQEGKCDRCGSNVVQLEKDVWFLKIKEYSEKLLNGLHKVDYLPRIKIEQKNWIGKSEGAEIVFEVKSLSEKIKIYTTRPDTIYGVTFLVIAPEHPLIDNCLEHIVNIDEVKSYREAAKQKNEFERVQLIKEKTGVQLKGISVVNPMTESTIPIFIADYVMMGYGTGAVMAVPAHDQRDWEFAKKYELPIVDVVEGGQVDREAYTECETGKMINSGFLNGLGVEKARDKIIDFVIDKGIGRKKTNYNMKDWAFNRQRYWGEPIPIINCNKCGMVSVSEDELPIMLPQVKEYRPTESGESPLANIQEWVNCKCPKCNGPAKRETDTMPQWASSSWYYLRYMDPHNNEQLVDRQKAEYWGQVDWYNGGMEHVTRHLIYSRFWNRALYDLEMVPNEEPYLKRTFQGLVLGEDGKKMSKSRGNVVDPIKYINDYGADVFRTFMLFMGDYEKPVAWSSADIIGVKRFIERVWGMQRFVVEEEYISDHLSTLNLLIKKVSDDIEALKFNTAIAAMMKFVNYIYNEKKIGVRELKDFIRLLNPFAPHITEEMWTQLGEKIILANNVGWPEINEELLKQETIELPVQVNGKVKGTVTVKADASLQDVKNIIKSHPRLSQLINVDASSKEIYKQGMILNFIIK